MKVKDESEKAGLKLNIQKTKIMTSSPNTSWQEDGEKVEAVTDFLFLVQKSLWMMTAAMDLRHLPIGRKAMTKPDSILKSRHHFADKSPSSQSYGFSSSLVWMESWAIKKAEHGGMDALELWCWRRLLRVPWTARRSNQSILKEINSEYSLEGLMLKLQYFGQTNAKN